MDNLIDTMYALFALMLSIVGVSFIVIGVRGLLRDPDYEDRNDGVMRAKNTSTLLMELKIKNNLLLNSESELLDGESLHEDTVTLELYLLERYNNANLQSADRAAIKEYFNLGDEQDV